MIVIDARGECLALSLYHLNEEACAKFSERDTLIVMDPVLKPIDFAHGDRVRARAVRMLHVAAVDVAAVRVSHRQCRTCASKCSGRRTSSSTGAL
jgi:hypothetical protein